MTLRSFALALALAAPAPAALLPGAFISAARAQQKLPLTLEDIWTKPTFRQATVPGFDWLRDGRYYAALDRTGSLTQYSVTTGQPTATLVDGEKNSVVSVSAYDVASARTVRMDVGPEPNQYIPRVMRTATPNLLSVQRLNRLQNKLEILHADARTGKSQVVLTDT